MSLFFQYFPIFITKHYCWATVLHTYNLKVFNFNLVVKPTNFETVMQFCSSVHYTNSAVALLCLALQFAR